MPTYLRKWLDRYILVRPTKWDGAEEVAPCAIKPDILANMAI